MITIDKGVPIPDPSWVEKYPWKQLEIGDSFVAPCEGDGLNLRSLIGCANSKHKPKRFVSRKVEGGRRIWRIE